MYDTIWDDSFNIGVEIIDKAHQRLASIVSKMMDLAHDIEHEKKRWACAEGVKYFKSYTIKHFAEEEAYMRSIGYEDHEAHKRIHDEMRDVTIPGLEQKLEDTDYSDQAVEDLLGVCMGWLTGHIMMEDRKITQSGVCPKEPAQNEEEIQHLIYALSQTIQELFGLETQVISEHYNGEDFGRALCYKMTYQNILGERLHVIFAVERPLVARTVGKMLFLTFHKINKTVISAMQQLSQQITHNLHTYFAHTDNPFSLYEDEMLSPRRFRQGFETGSSQYSLLLQTDLGCFAFCIRRP